MSKYIKTFIHRGVCYGIPGGVFIGQLVFFIILLTNDISSFETTREQFFIQFLASAFMGFYCTGLSVVYSIEEWSLLKQTSINLIFITIVYFPISYLTGWMPKNFFGIASFILTFIVFYIVVWNIFSYRVRSINEKLGKFNK